MENLKHTKSHMSAFKTSEVFTNSYKTSDWLWYKISHKNSVLGTVRARNPEHAVWRWVELNQRWCRKVNELKSVLSETVEV